MATEASLYCRLCLTVFASLCARVYNGTVTISTDLKCPNKDLNHEHIKHPYQSTEQKARQKNAHTQEFYNQIFR